MKQQQSESVRYEQVRLQQISNLAEELRQTSLKNVSTKQQQQQQESRKVQQRSRRPSGQWRITSVSIEENKVDTSNQYEEQYQKFERGGFAFQQGHHDEVESEAALLYSGGGAETEQRSNSSFTQSNMSQVQSFSNNSVENQKLSQRRSSTVYNTDQRDACYDERGESILQQTQNKSLCSELVNNDQSHVERRKSCFSSVEDISTSNSNTVDRGSTKYLPNFISLKQTEDQKLNSRSSGFPSRRRNSVSISCVGSGQSSSHSRASSVEPHQRPIFSFLKNSEENPHRSRQASNLASRRNSVVGLQKYSSQEYLNSGSNSNLKVRNNPIMLAQPHNATDKDESTLAKDGTLYQSTESLNCFKSRSRHSSGSGSQSQGQARDLYTWHGRNNLQGTGLRVGSAVTEPEPRDGLSLSRDGNFFMPFGNTENLGQKCKTRRQLKAEEQLRKQQEEQDEREQRVERERRKMRRQEKRNRNRTMSLSNSNRSQFDSSSTNKTTNKTEINSLENQNILEKNVINLTNNTENFNVSNKITTEIENIEILTKASDMKDATTMDTNTEKTGSINKENEELSLSAKERARDTSWQKFGAEYNEFGELISCGKEPLGKKDGFLLDYEKRDRSNAFWQVGEEYEGLVDGYGNRIDSIGINRGRWDNVQRGPLLHTSQNPDFVPDRSHPSNTGRRRF